MGQERRGDLPFIPTASSSTPQTASTTAIAIFHIDANGGALAEAGRVSTQGKTPRNFAIDPSGAFLLAANQDSNSIVVFRIDQSTGALTPTGREFSTSPRPYASCSPERTNRRESPYETKFDSCRGCGIGRLLLCLQFVRVLPKMPPPLPPLQPAVAAAAVEAPLLLPLRPVRAIER